MIKTTKKNYKCPYKEPPVLFMDMYVHISKRWFLIYLLHKMYGRATLPGILEETDEKIYFIVLQGGEDTVNKFRTCTLEGGRSIFDVTHRRHIQSISVTTKYYEIISLLLLTFFASVYINYICILDIRCPYWESVIVSINLVINKQENILSNVSNRNRKYVLSAF